MRPLQRSMCLCRMLIEIDMKDGSKQESMWKYFIDVLVAVVIEELDNPSGPSCPSRGPSSSSIGSWSVKSSTSSSNGLNNPSASGPSGTKPGGGGGG